MFHFIVTVDILFEEKNQSLSILKEIIACLTFMLNEKFVNHWIKKYL